MATTVDKPSRNPDLLYPAMRACQTVSRVHTLLAGALVVLLALAHPANAQALKLDGQIPVPAAKPNGDNPLGGTNAFRAEGDLTRAYDPAASNARPAYTGNGSIYLVAQLTGDGAPLDKGVVWRVFNETESPALPLALVKTAEGGDAEFTLPSGEYIIHAAYGRAGESKRVFVGAEPASETIVLNAGGLRLASAIAEDLPISATEVIYDIFHLDDAYATGREPIATGTRAGEIHRLNAGTYEVVSQYGSLNAVVRAEITVRPGQLTDATIYHRAAEVTLKLVNEPGGEALANTSWSILTPGGDVVFEQTGAFPSVILSEGDYSIVAKHEIGMFSRQFSVKAGNSRDVEVLTTGNR